MTTEMDSAGFDGPIGPFVGSHFRSVRHSRTTDSRIVVRTRTSGNYWHLSLQILYPSHAFRYIVPWIGFPDMRCKGASLLRCVILVEYEVVDPRTVLRNLRAVMVRRHFHCGTYDDFRRLDSE